MIGWGRELSFPARVIYLTKTILELNVKLRLVDIYTHYFVVNSSLYFIFHLQHVVSFCKSSMLSGI